MNARIGHRIGREDGFTLIELLVGMMMMLIIFSAALKMLEFSTRTEPKVRDTNSKIQTAQIAMERIIEDLRLTHTVVASPAPSATSLTVYTYLPRTTCGGSTLGTARSCKVVYNCSGGSCTRVTSELDGSSPSVTETVISGLSSNSVFTFSPSAAAAKSMTVTFTLPQTPGSSEDAVTLSDGVSFRNVAGAVGA